MHARQLTDEDRLNLFSLIDEHAANGIWVIDREGTTFWTNEIGRRLYNLSLDQTIGVPVREFEQRGVFRPAASLIALRERAPVTVTHKTACGRVTLACANPVLNDLGSVSLVIVSITDITHLVQVRRRAAPPGRQLAASAAARAPARLPSAEPGAGLVYRSAAMRAVLGRTRRLASADCAVLVCGETGVGKTEIARLIHALDTERRGRFVAVDCGALPATLIESELFGYVAGAFTGASRHDRPGLVQMADGGTLFLDEIGELPPELQVKLLRVLDDKRVRRVGAVDEQPVDFRLIAATNQDLRRLVQEGRFRSDLFYRLAVVDIEIPPLRDRPEDILPIAEAQLQAMEDKYRRRLVFSAEVLAAFEDYPWPGNVRELRNTVEALAVLGEEPVVELDDLPPQLRRNQGAASGGLDRGPAVPKLKQAVRSFERELVQKAIEQAGSYRAAARLLSISLPTLMRKRRG